MHLTQARSKYIKFLERMTKLTPNKFEESDYPFPWDELQGMLVRFQCGDGD